MLNCIARLLRTRSLAAFLLILMLLPAMVLTAQNISTAQLNGVVKDPTGAVVPGATVTISDPSKGFTRTTTTDGQGNYQLVLLLRGPIR